MASNIPEVPEGKTFVLFKKPGARAFSSNIQLSDGYTEVLDTNQKEMRSAVSRTVGRLKQLYRERGLKSKSAANKTGPSPFQIQKRQGLGLPITATLKEVRAALKARKNGVAHEPPKRGRPPNALKLDGRRENVAIGDEQWGEFVKLTENSNTAAMQQITQLLLLGMPAEDFQHTCRAIVVRRLKL